MFVFLFVLNIYLFVYSFMYLLSFLCCRVFTYNQANHLFTYILNCINSFMYFFKYSGSIKL